EINCLAAHSSETPTPRFLSATRTNSFFRFGRTGGGNLGHVCLDGADVELLANLGLHFSKNILVLFEEGSRIFAALANAFAGVAVPCAGLLDDVVGHGQVENVALATDAFAVKNVEFRFAEGCGHLVLDDLHLGTIAGDGV